MFAITCGLFVFVWSSFYDLLITPFLKYNITERILKYIIHVFVVVYTVFDIIMNVSNNDVKILANC